MRSVLPGTFFFSFLALVVIFVLGGCLAGKTNNPSFVVGEGGVPFASEPMDRITYQQEASRWQTDLRETVAPKKQAEAHLHLAALFLAKDNPQRDYHKGYNELTLATKAWPDLAENRAIASWLEMLGRFESECQNAKKDFTGLENKLALAQQHIAAQEQELARLRETLDKLKRLEMSVERKRRAFK